MCCSNTGFTCRYPDSSLADRDGSVGQRGRSRCAQRMDGVCPKARMACRAAPPAGARHLTPGSHRGVQLVRAEVTRSRCQRLHALALARTDQPGQGDRAVPERAGCDRADMNGTSRRSGSSRQHSSSAIGGDPAMPCRQQDARQSQSFPADCQSRVRSSSREQGWSSARPSGRRGYRQRRRRPATGGGDRTNPAAPGRPGRSPRRRRGNRRRYRCRCR